MVFLIISLQELSRLDIRKCSISQRMINELNKLPTDCIRASSVNMFMNGIEKYLIMAGYTEKSALWTLEDQNTSSATAI